MSKPLISVILAQEQLEKVGFSLRTSRKCSQAATELVSFRPDQLGRHRRDEVLECSNSAFLPEGKQATPKLISLERV